MRIKDALGQTLKPLNEALRMTSEMKRIADSSAGEFRFGVEYEFHLNDDINTGGSSFYTDEQIIDAMERARENLKLHLEELTSFMYAISTVLEPEKVEDLIEDMGRSEAADRTQDEIKRVVQFLKAKSGSAPIMRESITPDISSILLEGDVEADIFINLASNLNEATIRNENDLIELWEDNETLISRTTEQIYENRFPEEGGEASGFADIISSNAIERYDTSTDVEEFVQGFVDEEISGDIDDEQNIQFIESVIEDRDLSSYIEGVELDGSVSNGVEVITKPLSFSDTIYTMKQMFEIIDDFGYTSDRTGMHVNISHASFKQGESIDPLKLSALMDVEYFQGRSEGGIVKYDMRNEMVRSTFYEINQPMLVDVATAYIRKGVEGMEDKLKSKLIGRGNKYRDINWTALIGEFNSASRRIEFRFFGGSDYEDRLREIAQDLKYIMAVVKVITDDSFAPQDYYKGLIRILTRATRRVAQQEGKYFPYGNFSEVVQAVKKGDVISGLDRNDALDGIMSDFS